MTTKTHKIPLFDLYGDSKHYQDPDFVHIEEISERSSINGWKIKPHRHGRMLQVLCLYSGTLSAALDSSKYQLHGSWALVIPPGTVHGFSFSPDTKGIVLTVAESAISKEFTEEYERYLETFKQQSHVIKLDQKKELFDQLKLYVSLIKTELNTSEPGYEIALQGLVRMLLLTLRRQLDYTRFEVTTGQPVSNNLIKFRKLLEEQFRQHWTVKEYAAALHMSESTLNRLCHEIFGSPTKTIIDQRMLTAIKRQLIFTKQPLEQIAYNLGYKDSSYFSRFFKKHTCMSPSQYRKLKADAI